ncbi:ribonuclease Y [mine drainage metagenome]|uniref:Ribonuclease Y n=1 Tax=mine drainage metagenome TaxID=410659 RepID=A0A1J5TCD0_9ZZZZ
MEQTTESHYISPDDLRIGHYVHLDLGWMEHPFTFSNFQIKNEEQIAKIRGLKLKKIRYNPLRSKVAYEFPKTIQEDWSPKTAPLSPSPLQRSERLKQLNNARINCEKEFAKNANATREAIRILIHHPEHATKLAENVVNEMVNSIITESDVALHAINNNISGYSNHALNVAVLGLMLVKSLNLKEDDATTLGLASIFHDVGKSDNHLNKSYVDLHCEAGARIALRSGLSERISKIIFQHHEYADGSGYPMHLTSDKIDGLAHILLLVNHYDNLCNPDNAAEGMTPYEALQHMYVYQAQKFDLVLLKRLIKLLGVYPSGSVVQLSNDTYGVVTTVNSDKPLQPLVMIYSAEVARETPVVIDLSEEIDISIKQCINPSKLPPEVFNYLKPSKRICYYFLKEDKTKDAKATFDKTIVDKNTQQDHEYDPKITAKS